MSSSNQDSVPNLERNEEQDIIENNTVHHQEKELSNRPLGNHNIIDFQYEDEYATSEQYDLFAASVIESLKEDIETIIIDLSSSKEITVGMGGEHAPRLVFTQDSDDSLSQQIENVVSEISSQTTLLQETTTHDSSNNDSENELKSSSSRALLIIDSSLSHMEDLNFREEMTEIIFNHSKLQNVKYLSIQDASYLTSLACSKISAIVVHLGHQTSHVVAVVDGQVRMDSLRTIENGGMSEQKLNEELARRLKLVNEQIPLTQELLDRVKQNLKCCVNHSEKNEQESFQVESCSMAEDTNTSTCSNTLTLGHEIMYQIMEDLFFSSQHKTSLPQIIADCISYISDESLDLERNIIVSGSGCIPLIQNFHERLSSDLRTLLGLEIVIDKNSQARNLAWIGASTLTSVPEWVSPFCVTRELFEQEGSSCICSKSYDVIYSSLF
ncbi:hypothetical protein C9374_007048 [Naegleria lovaniensis]|uniref:Actin n=1 Tax=Naegleria lovaniensis TaxID=51637 RepID=A0AA88KRT0_NAELO|nr:uncharacterized protein C9374_007048 [Naegleria lovaniensis]KAG2393517.1 hypothetical protein C9374_007048 [Naegleria lovaniensis]